MELTLSEKKRQFLEFHVFKGKIIDHFLGRGGLVYIVEQDCIPKFVAYKTVQEFEEEDISTINIESIEHIEREVGNWFKYSNHPLVIKPFSVTLVNKFPFICMPYCNGNISDFTSSQQGITSVICFSLQIIKGLIEAKKAGLRWHQDIKPENILYIDLSAKYKDYPPLNVDSCLKYSLKIADFGVANAYLNGHLGGTNVYKAPEQYDPTIFPESFEPDIFSVGLIMAELFQGYHPAVLSKNENQNINKWRGSKLKRWAFDGDRNFKNAENETESILINLIDKMLSPDSNLRPSLESCYKILSETLKKTDHRSYEFLDAIISYYDKISDLYYIQGRLSNLIKLSKIKSQLTSTLTTLSIELDSLMNINSNSVNHIITIYYYVKTLYLISNNNQIKDYDALIISVLEMIVDFLLKHNQEITSQQLYPVMNNDTSIGSDFESRAEMFNESLKILSHLNYHGDLNTLISDSTDKMIKAFVIYDIAQSLRLAHQHRKAYEKLCELRSLISIDSKFEEVFTHWKKEIDLWDKIKPSAGDK